MTNHWTKIESQFQKPITVEDAIERLEFILPDEVKTELANLEEFSLIDLHFTLGKAIRNGFDLYQQDSALCIACGTSNADDASMILIHHLWKKLTKS